MFWGFKSRITHPKNGISRCQQNPCGASYKAWYMNQTSMWKGVFENIFQFLRQENIFGWWDSNPQLFYPLKKHSTVMSGTSFIKFYYTVAFLGSNWNGFIIIFVYYLTQIPIITVKGLEAVCNRPDCFTSVNESHTGYT